MHKVIRTWIVGVGDGYITILNIVMMPDIRRRWQSCSPVLVRRRAVGPDVGGCCSAHWWTPTSPGPGGRVPAPGWRGSTPPSQSSPPSPSPPGRATSETQPGTARPSPGQQETFGRNIEVRPGGAVSNRQPVTTRTWGSTSLQGLLELPRQSCWQEASNSHSWESIFLEPELERRESPSSFSSLVCTCSQGTPSCGELVTSPPPQWKVSSPVERVVSISCQDVWIFPRGEGLDG